MPAYRRWTVCSLLSLVLGVGGCGDRGETPQGNARPSETSGQPSPPEAPAGDAASLEPPRALDEAAIARAMERGRAYLVSRQDASGAFGEQAAGGVDAGYTAMAVMGLAGSLPRNEVRSYEPIRNATAWLVRQQKENGSIWDKPVYANYHTSTAIGALAATKFAEHAAVQAKARAYLLSTQITGDESDPSYGGFPYKQEVTGSPADLSNLQMAAQALHDDGGVERDNPVWARMQHYLRRVQNSSETNDWTAQVEVGGEMREVVPGDDGGAFYNPGAVAQDFKADLVQRSDGRYEPRSYGSMSYALLKCLLFAGVPANDPRIERVVQWIGRHWTVERNPGFEAASDPEKAGRNGWFYYLYTAARALSEYEAAKGEAFVVRDAEGRAHDWRAEIAALLLRIQAEDGSWRNELSERWDEGSKVLATSYALQTLAYVTKRLP